MKMKQIDNDVEWEQSLQKIVDQDTSNVEVIWYEQPRTFIRTRHGEEKRGEEKEEAMSDTYSSISDDKSTNAEPVYILGVDISHLAPQSQFILCASGVFFFLLFYGYLQELLSVRILNRHLGLFLAFMQFAGYTVCSSILNTFVYQRTSTTTQKGPHVPLSKYIGISFLRAMELGLTNWAMMYVNYPAKTLMKSSRVVFTMLFGVVIIGKRYRKRDYVAVMLMVLGLAIFMHADSTSSAVFDSLGIIMLTLALMCDGAISNMSEAVMTQFGIGQDEFLLRMNSIALLTISTAAAAKGDLQEGLLFLTQRGAYNELDLPIEDKTWASWQKICVFIAFSLMGFLGSSCAAAITKIFGAFSMSMVSTVRKATTLFLSFALFDNECTLEHVGGIALFISALTFKSFSRIHKAKKEISRSSSDCDLELALKTTSRHCDGHS